MKKILFYLFLCSPVGAVNVTVINSTQDPVNVSVSGNVSVNTSTHVSVDNFPNNQSVTVSNQSSTFTLVNTATITFSGISQPVNFPSPTVFLATTSVSISGSSNTVQVSNFPASQVVTGTFFQATQPVSFVTPFSVFVATSSVSINGSSNTVQISGTPNVNATTVNTTTVTFNGIAQPVSGTFFQTTQPVSFTTPYSVFLATVSALISGSSNTVQISGTPTIANMGFNVNNSPSVFVSSTSCFISGSSNTVSLTSVPTHAVTFSLGTSTTAAVPLRPSQGINRTYKQGVLDNLTGNATAYTVTAGKTLYITSLNFSGFNTSSSASGHIAIQDGGVNRIPITIPTAGVGALASQIPIGALQFLFQEPKQFTTNINVNLVAGTITYSMDFTGYEE